MSKKIVAITACPAGIAHTYMAANALESVAKANGYVIKVEKQGSMGIENALTSEEIDEADLVIIAVNKTVELDRFKGKLVYQCSADHAIKQKKVVMEQAFSQATIYGTEEKKSKSITLGKSNLAIMNHLMTGLSYMGQVSASVCLLLAFYSFFQNTTNPTIASILPKIKNIIDMGFLITIPMFAGMIANSIAGMPAIGPAMIGAYVANNQAYLGTQTGGGFISAIIVALIVGYLVLFLKNLKWHAFFKPILAIVILPLLSSVPILLVITYIIGVPLANFSLHFYQGLINITTDYPILKFIFGAIIGGMVGFDFGGSLNKTAILTTCIITTDTMAKYGVNAIFEPWSAAISAIAIAPMGIWLASKLFAKYFDSNEIESAKDAFKTGLQGMSEAAIEFALVRPKQIIVSSVIGSSIAGGLAYFFNLKVFLAVGSPLGAIFGYIEGPMPILPWLFVTFCGILSTALVLGIFRISEGKLNKKRI